MGRIVEYSGRCRLIVSDMDYTFLDDAKSIPPENAEAVSKAMEQGVQFAFASGRAWCSIRPFAAELGLSCPQIVNNGSSLVSPATGELLCLFPMEPRTGAFVYEGYFGHGFAPVLFRGAEIVSERDDAATRAVLGRNLEPLSIEGHGKAMEMIRGGVEKMAVVSPERERELAELSAAIYSEARSRGMDYTHSFTEKGVMVFSSSVATKLNGIRRLCAMLGCSMADVVAVGDGDNDAEMLAGVGMGVAVANATPMAKRSASMVTMRDSSHGAFAEAVREFIS